MLQNQTEDNDNSRDDMRMFKKLYFYELFPHWK